MNTNAVSLKRKSRERTCHQYASPPAHQSAQGRSYSCTAYWAGAPSYCKATGAERSGSDSIRRFMKKTVNGRVALWCKQWASQMLSPTEHYTHQACTASNRLNRDNSILTTKINSIAAVLVVSQTNVVRNAVKCCWPQTHRYRVCQGSPFEPYTAEIIATKCSSTTNWNLSTKAQSAQVLSRPIVNINGCLYASEQFIETQRNDAPDRNISGRVTPQEQIELLAGYSIIKWPTRSSFRICNNKASITCCMCSKFPSVTSMRKEDPLANTELFECWWRWSNRRSDIDCHCRLLCLHQGWLGM